uniref:Uncharacterized protein n=1 Tax=Opuntia streptacantha TaxID=393608 RepID=A0A7C9E4C0_OPUST
MPTTILWSKQLRCLSCCPLDVPSVVRRRDRQPPCRVGKIQARIPSPQRQRRHVMSPGRHFRSRVRAEPNPGLVIRGTNLAHPPVAVPLPHSSVHRVASLLKLLPPRLLLRAARRQRNAVIFTPGIRVGALTVFVLHQQS